MNRSGSNSKPMQVNQARTPRNTTAVKATKSSSSDPWMVFLMKVLFVALIILMLPKLVEGGKRSRTAGTKHRKKTERKLSAIRDECQYESARCKSNVIEEALNCVHQCMSETCYHEVYSQLPLEDGEIDVSRLKDFERCVKEELREERVRQREEERRLKREMNSK